jgi:hypothetical protein
MEALLARIDLRRDLEDARGLKALHLSTTLNNCRALIRGERIPWQDLDAKNAERYGLRDGHRRPDGRYGVDDFNDVRREHDLRR